MIMKRVILMAAVICISHIATAQKPESTPSTNTEKQAQEKSAYVTLQAGQVMLVKDNKAEKLATDLTLKDGTTVQTDGTVKKQDGSTIVMKEGDRLYVDGSLSMSKKDKVPME
jgi:LysM repeat protein